MGEVPRLGLVGEDELGRGIRVSEPRGGGVSRMKIGGGRERSRLGFRRIRVSPFGGGPVGLRLQKFCTEPVQTDSPNRLDKLIKKKISHSPKKKKKHKSNHSMCNKINTW